MPVDFDMAQRLRPLARPLQFSPGCAGPLLVFGSWPVLLTLAIVGAYNGWTGWPGLFVLSLLVPYLAFPLLILRLLMGFGIGAYRHDVTAPTFWRSRGRPNVQPALLSITGWRLRPRIDYAPVAASLSGMTFAEVDHGAAGAVVFAIRDGDGKTVYDMQSPRGKTTWLWIIAAMAVAWTVLTGAGATALVNFSRSSSVQDMGRYQNDVATLSAAPRCVVGDDPSGRECYVLKSGQVTSLTDPSSGEFFGCLALTDVPNDNSYPVQMAPTCHELPGVGMAVDLRIWDGKVMDLSAGGRRYDSVDSPSNAYRNAQIGRDSMDAFGWIWLVAPILYSLMLSGSHLAWRLGKARRRAKYAKTSSETPTAPVISG